MQGVGANGAPAASKVLKGLLATAQHHGPSIQPGTRVLVWGCDSADLVLELTRRVPQIAASAAFVSGIAHERCAAQLEAQGRNVDVQACGYQPPLPWSNDSFDVVLAPDGMTRLPADVQIAWSYELGRVLKPSGLLLALVQGREACTRNASPVEQEDLASHGFSGKGMGVDPHGNLPLDAYRDTFQTAEWTAAKWQGLRVLESIQLGGQGSFELVVARPATACEPQEGRAGRAILVTGAHRSGSTFSGRMLSAGPDTLYVQEPFNPHYRDLGVCSARFDRFFTWVHSGNEEGYRRPFEQLTQLLPASFPGLLAARNREELELVSKRAQFWRAARESGKRALLKDPIALFSAPWIASRCEADVVVLLRHPAGFVASVKRLGWQTAIWDLVEQSGMGEAMFPAWLERSKQLVSLDADIIDQAATFWAVAYSVVDDYRRQHPEWAFIYYEDLCEAPLATFRALYHRLGLSFSLEAQATIESYTSPNNTGEVKVDEVYAPVDSRANVELWKERLTPEEIERVREITKPVAERFYGPGTW